MKLKIFKKIEIPNEWIKKLAEDFIEEEKINSLGSFEKLMETLKKRLKNKRIAIKEKQMDRYGEHIALWGHGHNPEGFVLQHESRHKRAVKVGIKESLRILIVI